MGALQTETKASFGEGTGLNFLDGVNCVGTEDNLGNCSHQGWRVQACSHGGEASVECTSGSLLFFLSNILVLPKVIRLLKFWPYYCTYYTLLFRFIVPKSHV